MADLDDITEFTDLDPEEIHLVSTPANRFSALLAKNTTPKGQTMKKKQLRALLKQATTHTAGADPAAAERLARVVGRRAVDLSGGASTASGLFKAMDVDIADARKEVAGAADEFQTMRATARLRTALRRRALAKMVSADNARRRGDLPSGRFGPNSAQLFDGTHSIGDDAGLGYVGGRR